MSSWNFSKVTITYQNKTRCVCETQMPPKETDSIKSHVCVKAFEK
jgi:hypothetical protein